MGGDVAGFANLEEAIGFPVPVKPFLGSHWKFESGTWKMIWNELDEHVYIFPIGGHSSRRGLVHAPQRIIGPGRLGWYRGNWLSWDGFRILALLCPSCIS